MSFYLGFHWRHSVSILYQPEGAWYPRLQVTLPSEPVPGLPTLESCLQLTTGWTHRVSRDLSLASGLCHHWRRPAPGDYTTLLCIVTTCHIVSLSISGPRLGAVTEVREYDFILIRTLSVTLWFPRLDLTLWQTTYEQGCNLGNVYTKSPCWASYKIYIKQESSHVKWLSLAFISAVVLKLTHLLQRNWILSLGGRETTPAGQMVPGNMLRVLSAR